MNQGIRNADCTLFHKEWDEEARRDVWSCMQLPGVSWYSKKGISVGTTGETAEDTVVIRVYTQQALAVDTGDIITPGLVTAQDRRWSDERRVCGGARPKERYCAIRCTGDGQKVSSLPYVSVEY